MTNKTHAYAAGIGASVIFGFSFLFTKNALDHIEPFHLIGFRFLLAALVLTVLRFSGVVKISFKGKDIKPLLFIAFFQPFVYFICETYGIKLTSSSQAGMMIALIPIVVALLSKLVLNERATVMQVVSICLSVSGVLFIIFVQSGWNLLGGNMLGYLLLLGAVSSAAMFNLLSRKSSSEFKPLEITFVMMWVGAIVFNLVSVTQHVLAGNLGSFFAPLSVPSVVTSTLYLSIVSSIGAFFMINYALSRLLASQAAVFANLTTIVSIIAGVVFRNEDFFWYHAVGALMILIGVWGTNYFTRSAKKHTQSVGVK